jgi:hypothetical protein
MNLEGKKFGFLTVLERDKTKPPGKGVYWLCLCDCGKETTTKTDRLKSGHVKSCGHISGENTKKAAAMKAEQNNVVIKRHENYSEISLHGVITLIDNNLLNEVMKYNWLTSNAGYLFRHVHKGKTVWLHRFVMGSPPKEKVVDHKNHNKLDNRCENLRVCTEAENARNTVLRKNNRTGYKGVYALNGKFYARINVYGKSISLGLHDTAEEAHEEYKKAAARYFGEYACTG